LLKQNVRKGHVFTPHPTLLHYSMQQDRKNIQRHMYQETTTRMY